MVATVVDWDLVGAKAMHQVATHSENVSTPSCRVALEDRIPAELWMYACIVVLSAYTASWTFRGRWSLASLTYGKNRFRPNVLPCGTPAVVLWSETCVHPG